MKSILARLEALEAKSPERLLLAVQWADGTIKRINVDEYVALALGNTLPGSGPGFRVISGGSLSDLDKLLNAVARIE